MNTLKEKYGSYALITGASSGIGEEFAIRLAREGMNLILVARRKERLENLKSELESKNKIEVVVVPLDLAQDNFLDVIKEFIGNKEIGLLINNAGFGFRGEFFEADPDHYSKMIKLNCTAPTLLTHYILPQMIQRKKGAMIFLGSLVAFQPTPMTATYAATKVFNAFLSDALWYELRKYNIDVLSLNPGGTKTEFQSVANSSTGPFQRTSEQVVDTAMKALGKKPSVVDGVYNKILAVASRFISRKLTIICTGKISESLYKKS